RQQIAVSVVYGDHGGFRVGRQRHFMLARSGWNLRARGRRRVGGNCNLYVLPVDRTGELDNDAIAGSLQPRFKLDALIWDSDLQASAVVTASRSPRPFLFQNPF